MVVVYAVRVTNVVIIVFLIAFQNQGYDCKLNYNETFFFLFNCSMLTAFFKSSREC
jgi:hypothetical protein